MSNGLSKDYAQQIMATSIWSEDYNRGLFSFTAVQVLRRLHKEVLPVTMKALLEEHYPEQSARIRNEPILRKEVDMLVNYGAIMLDPTGTDRAYILTPAFVEKIKLMAPPPPVKPKKAPRPIYSAKYRILGADISARTFRKIYQLAKLMVEIYDDPDGQVDDLIDVKVNGRKLTYHQAVEFINHVEENETFEDN